MSIDCDVHNEVPRGEALFPYLPDYWIEHLTNTLFKGPTESPYPPGAPVASRPGSKPADGTPAGSSLSLLQEQVLDPTGVDYAVLNCLYAIDSLHNPDAAVALASAVNDWQIAEWLDREPRLRASIVVPSQIPHLAAREIERVGNHPGFVQVLLPARAQHPYGSRLFHPLWEAIARHDLVAGIHFGGSPRQSAHALRLAVVLLRGVRRHGPGLRLPGHEHGERRRLRPVPDVAGDLARSRLHLAASPYVALRQGVAEPAAARAVGQTRPVRVHPRALSADGAAAGCPGDPRGLVQVVDQLGSDDMLLYASDYPHQHVADAETGLLGHLPPALANKIRSDNARAWYRL